MCTIFIGIGPTRSAHAAGDGQEKLWVLLVNMGEPTGDASGGYGSFTNDIEDLDEAFSQGDTRVRDITHLWAFSWANVQAAVAQAFLPADGDDVCVYYQTGHGGKMPDQNLEPGETDGKDGKLQANVSRVRDDNFDSPFEEAIQAGKCGAGMLVMIGGCYVGETVVGAADFSQTLAPHVVITSASDTQESGYKGVGGHGHTLFGARGFLIGISDTNADGVAEADANSNGVVTASELFTYISANDNDPGADPQIKNAPSTLRVLVASHNLFTHGTQVTNIGAGSQCLADDEPVGGVSAIRTDAVVPPAGQTDPSARSGSLDIQQSAGGALLVVLATFALWWSFRRDGAQ
jgi:hypothetical protein